MSLRDQYIEKAKARIAQWDAEIDKMRAKADEAEADAKIEYYKQVDDMRARREEAESWLSKLGDASDDAWEDVKSGFDKAWDDIIHAFDRASSRYH